MNTSCQEAIIAIGTNVADRKGQIDCALEALRATTGIESVERGPVIETDPVLPSDSFQPQPSFLNTVAAIATRLAPEVLMSRLLAIEAQLGRRRTGSVAPRTIDLDLLVVGELRCARPGLILPHPRMWDRAFVMEPLEALRPGLADRLAHLKGG